MRLWLGSLVAVAAAVIIAACSGSSPVTPSPGDGSTPPVNTPPQIKSITLSDQRAEVGTPITVIASVEDAETPVANLTYTWTADTGTFSGSGPTVTWVAGPDAQTPADVALTLTVTERYSTGTTTAENIVTSSTSVHVNNSPKELADLSLRFLGNFANSGVSPKDCTSEFSDICGSGKADEISNISDNRHDFKILASTLRATSVELPPARLTAKVHTFCAFTSRVITTQPQSGGCSTPGSCPLDSVQSVQGDCWTTNVYDQGRWWLCESHFTGNAVPTAFERAFFGIRGPQSP
jgi:hypothetical protein